MKPKEGDRFLLDTSALLALHFNEEGADRVETILRSAEKGQTLVLISFVSRMEMLYVIWKDHGRQKAIESLYHLNHLPITVVESNEEILFKAAEVKATIPLSFADSWVAATAIQENACLVHKDPEFDSLKDILQMIRLA